MLASLLWQPSNSPHQCCFWESPHPHKAAWGTFRAAVGKSGKLGCHVWNLDSMQPTESNFQSYKRTAIVEIFAEFLPIPLVYFLRLLFGQPKKNP